MTWRFDAADVVDVNYEGYHARYAMKMKNPCHPGEILRESITDGLGLSIAEAAAGIGVSRKQLSAILNVLNERAGISPEMAIRLEKAVGSTAEQWLQMQVAYDLALARKGAGRLKVRKLEPAQEVRSALGTGRARCTIAR